MEVSKYNQMMSYLTRPRERFSNGGISLKEVNKYRKEGLKAADIIEKLDVGLSKYEEFLTKNKSKLVPVSSKKITKER